MTIEIDLDDNGQHWLSEVRSQAREKMKQERVAKMKERMRQAQKDKKNKRGPDGKVRQN